MFLEIVLIVLQSIKNIFLKKEKKFKKKKKNPNNSYINFLIIAKIIIQEYKLVLRYFILWAGD